jgi:DNA-directed RNA polymerase specialized sigma subunit
MKEIGDTLGLSESRVRQMHKVLVKRLQVHLGKRRLDIAT